MSGTLFVVPTPIGNRQDMTLRSIEILQQADIVAAEDTRHSGQLLAHLDIRKPMISYQEHNELQRIPVLLNHLQEGKDIALISDAGTPTLSDPGFRLVRAANEAGIAVDALPGASSVTVALSGSGLPTDKFYFGGFLPRTSGKRKTAFASVSQLPATLIFFESPFRIGKALKDALTELGDRPAVVARELTKVHQEYHRASLSELSHQFATDVKGEIVLLIAGISRSDRD